MSAESFFDRWARRNADAAAARQAEVAVKETSPAAPPPAPPTLEDAGKLTSDSDFRPFVARGVEEDIRRTALKKLFADPHFNVMDGLDVYIEDYNKFEPIPPEMLAMLSHAKDLLNPLGLRTQSGDEDARPAAAEAQQVEATGVPETTGAGNETEPDAARPEEETPNHDDPVQDL